MLNPRMKNRHGFLKSSLFRFFEIDNNTPIIIAPIKNLAAVMAPGSISFATMAPKIYETDTHKEKRSIAPCPQISDVSNDIFFIKSSLT